MTASAAFRIRLLLGVATGMVLLTCAAAAWALPRPLVGADAEPVSSPTAATVPARSDPCDVLLGPARDFCGTAVVKDATPAAPAASSRSASSDQAPWLLLFSTITVAAAIGLCITAGRPSR
jgi:hypothetical protein